MNRQRGQEAIRQAQGLLIQQAGRETLVYNERTHQAFCLNPVSAEVWHRLDGVQTPKQIAVAACVALGTPVTEEAVLFAIAELRGNGLVAPEPQSQAIPIPTRRDLLRQVGAGAIMMLPAVAVVMAPKAAQAYNGCVNCEDEPSKGTLTSPPVRQRRPARQPDYELLQPAAGSDGTDTTRKKRQQNGEIFVP